MNMIVYLYVYENDFIWQKQIKTVTCWAIRLF